MNEQINAQFGSDEFGVKLDAWTEALQHADFILFNIQKRPKFYTKPEMRIAIAEMIRGAIIRRNHLSPDDIAVHTLEVIQKRRLYGLSAREDISRYVSHVFRKHGLLKEQKK